MVDTEVGFFFGDNILTSFRNPPNLSNILVIALDVLPVPLSEILIKSAVHLVLLMLKSDLLVPTVV